MASAPLPGHPPAPTLWAPTTRANRSTETRGRPGAKRKRAQAAGEGGPAPCPAHTHCRQGRRGSMASHRWAIEEEAVQGG